MLLCLAAILMARSSPPWVTVDRPFLFLIRHNPTGTDQRLCGNILTYSQNFSPGHFGRAQKQLTLYIHMKATHIKDWCQYLSMFTKASQITVWCFSPVSSGTILFMGQINQPWSLRSPLARCYCGITWNSSMHHQHTLAFTHSHTHTHKSFAVGSAVQWGHAVCHLF